MTVEGRSNLGSLRLPSDIQDKLNRISAGFGHSQRWFVIRALQLYMLEEGGDLLNIIEGREQIARGEVHDMDDVIREIEDIVHGRTK